MTHNPKHFGLSKLRNKARVIKLKLRETARCATSIFRPRKDDCDSLSIGPKAAKRTDSPASECEPGRDAGNGRGGHLKSKQKSEGSLKKVDK
jgi:hypothetical protein